MKRPWLFAATLATAAACKPCVDFTPGRPYQCSQPGFTDQCAGAWRCSTAHVCFDPAVGAALPCDPSVAMDAGQCPDLWRCGLEGTCHAIGDAGAYPCNSDIDCEDGWRCDIVGGRCVDATSEGLSPDAYYGALTGQRISPVPYFDTPTVVASTPVYRPCLVCDFFAQQIAIAVDGGVVQIDLTFRSTLALTSLTTTPWPRPISALAQAEQLTYVLDSQGVWTLNLADGGTSKRWSTAGEDRLRIGGPNDTQVVSFGGSHISGASQASTNPVPFTGVSLPALDGGAQPLLDIALPSTGELLAIGEDGASESPWSQAGNFQWIALNNGAYSNLECLSQIPVLPIRFLPVGANGQTAFVGWVGMGTQFGQATYVLNLDITATPVPQSGNCSSGPLPLAIEEMNPTCPQGYVQTAVDSSSALPAQDVPDAATYIVLCQPGPDAGGPARIYTAGPVPYQSSGVWTQIGADSSNYFADMAAMETDRPGFQVAAGRHGEFWLPNFVSGEPLGLWLDRGADSLGTDGNTAVIAANGQVYALGPHGFVVSGYGDAGTTPAVFFEGQRTLLLSVLGESPQFSAGFVNDLSNLDAGVLATIDGQVFPLRPPFHAQAVTLSDGGTEWVVAAFNLVYAGAPGGALSIKTNLPTEVPIESIELHAGTSDELDGYVVAQDGVRALQARDEQRWVLTPVDVPSGPWLSTWTDGTRERLGYSDGTVYALPARVQIGAPFPTAQSLGLPGCDKLTATDFQDLCGQPYALTTCGVLRLFPDAGAIGTWQLEPSLLQAGFADADLAGATAEVLNNTLTVTSRFGETVQLTAQCP